jgi:hypothetical protein
MAAKTITANNNVILGKAVKILRDLKFINYKNCYLKKSVA